METFSNSFLFSRGPAFLHDFEQNLSLPLQYFISRDIHSLHEFEHDLLPGAYRIFHRRTPYYSQGIEPTDLVVSEKDSTRLSNQIAGNIDLQDYRPEGAREGAEEIADPELITTGTPEIIPDLNQLYIIIMILSPDS